MAITIAWERMAVDDLCAGIAALGARPRWELAMHRDRVARSRCYWTGGLMVARHGGLLSDDEVDRYEIAFHGKVLR